MSAATHPAAPHNLNSTDASLNAPNAEPLMLAPPNSENPCIRNSIVASFAPRTSVVLERRARQAVAEAQRSPSEA